MGLYLIGKLNALKMKYNIIAEVRGSGLMVGMEFSSDIAGAIKEKMFERKILVGSVKTRIIRLLPPLIVKKEHIDTLCTNLEEVLGEITGGNGG